MSGQVTAGRSEGKQAQLKYLPEFGTVLTSNLPGIFGTSCSF